MNVNSLTHWTKLGKIFIPQREIWWMHSYAMIPTVLELGGDLYRVFFSGRDKNNRSHIGAFDISLNNPFKVLNVTQEPLLAPGELGCFDDSGVSPSWAVRHGNKIYLYYIGWNLRSSVRMGLVAGLAVSDDDGKTFKRFSRGPLLERTDQEPFAILTGPCVLKDKDIWKMWYVSGTGWVNPDLPTYNIKYAESKDGVHWTRNAQVCIALWPDEHALARPCVLQERGLFKMWYSFKGENYRIGYAESYDGLSWTRKDEEAGIGISLTGWDNQMIEYAYVFNHNEKKYMFYNGNNYGMNGIGLATRENNT